MVVEISYYSVSECFVTEPPKKEEILKLTRVFFYNVEDVDYLELFSNFDSFYFYLNKI